MSKCSCIPGVNVCEWCGPVRTLYDNQAKELIAPPVPQVERSRPERATNDKLVNEFAPPGPLSSYQSGQVVKAGLPTVFQIAGPFSALSLGGIVPFNAIAFLVPYDKLPFLQNDATLMALSQEINGAGAMGGFSGYPGLDWYWMMRPGEVVNFQRPMPGVAGFWCAPWSGINPINGTSQSPAHFVNTFFNSFGKSRILGAAAANVTTPYGTNGGDYGPFVAGPVFAPQFRAHYTQCQTLSVPVYKAPWVMPNVPLIKPNGSVCIPPGAKTVTVSFRGGSAQYSSPSWQNNFATDPYAADNYMMQGKGSRVASGNWELWVDWYSFSGQVHRHPSDNFNPSGRGYVSLEHDIEVFDVPRVASAMNVYWANNNPIGTTNVIASTFAFGGGD